MRIERVFARPAKHTFTIPPIRKLLLQEMNGGTWLDPMAGFNSPAHITNDINPDTPTDYHEDALEFLRRQPREHYDGILFDPPWSYQNAISVYALKDHPSVQRGIVPFYNYIRQCRKALIPLVKPNGKILVFGLDSMGIGRSNGFVLERILLVTSQWQRPDIIVTVSRKVQTTLQHSGAKE